VTAETPGKSQADAGLGAYVADAAETCDPRDKMLTQAKIAATLGVHPDRNADCRTF
jgi:hypothetical protein